MKRPTLLLSFALLASCASSESINPRPSLNDDAGPTASIKRDASGSPGMPEPGGVDGAPTPLPRDGGSPVSPDGPTTTTTPVIDPTPPGPRVPLPTITGSWPRISGPNSNYAAGDGTKLLEDLSLARLVWESEETNVPPAKLNKSRPSGGFASMILTDGLVVASYYQPAGEVTDPSFTAYRSEGLSPDFYKIEADDVVLAMDARTGKTAWKQVYARKGVNIPFYKRYGTGPSPTAGGGKVFALGTTGRVYAIDAKTGKPAWESALPIHKDLEAQKAAALQARKMVERVCGVSLVYASGMLVVPDMKGTTVSGRPTNMGLVGLDPATGTVKWELPDVTGSGSTPAVVTFDGKEYLLAGSEAGELRLIDPKDGRVLWTQTGLGVLREPIAPSLDHHVLLNMAPATAPYRVYAGWQFSSTGAKKVWDVPTNVLTRPSEGDVDTHGYIVPIKDAFYALSRGAEGDGFDAVAIKTASGAVLARTAGVLKRDWTGTGISIAPAVSGLEDRFLVHRDTGHNAFWFRPFRLAGAALSPVGPHWNPLAAAATGYEIVIHHPYAQGLLWMRGGDGRVRCWDLRAEGNPPQPKGDALFVRSDSQEFAVSANDVLIAQRLDAAGFRVSSISGAQLEEKDVAGKSLVVVGSGGRGFMEMKLQNVTVPMIVTNGFYFDDWGMAGLTYGTEHGYVAGHTIDITMASHPLAAGLSGMVTVSAKAAPLAFGVVAPTAQVVAHLPGDPTKAVLFGYKAGDMMVGRTTPARRVGFFSSAEVAMTAEGAKLLDAAIAWAMEK